MGWCLYLIDKKERVALTIGKVPEDDVYSDFETYKKFKEYLKEVDIINLNEARIKNITLNQMKHFLTAFDFVQRLSWIQTPLFVLDYMYYHQENEFEFKMEVPKGYTVISLW